MFKIHFIRNRNISRDEVHLEGDIKEYEGTIIVGLSVVLYKCWKELYSQEIGYKAFLKGFTEMCLDTELLHNIKEVDIDGDTCNSPGSFGKLQ